MPWRRWLALAVLQCLVGVASAAVLVPAELKELSLRPYLDVLEDPGGQRTIEDVERPESAAQFRHVDGLRDLNYGITTAAVWFRVQLRSDSDVPAVRLLEVAHPSLDKVEFFSRRAGGLVHLQSGFMTPFDQRPYVHRNLVFPLAMEPGVTHTVFLRVTSRGSLTVPVSLWTPQALHASDQQSYSLLAFYFGMIFALAAYNLLLYFSLRDPIYLSYTGFAACMAAAQSAMLGFGSEFLWPQWPQAGNWVLPSCFSLTGLFAAMFVRQFLNTAELLPRLDRLIVWLQLGFLASAIGPAFFENRPFAISTAVLGTIFCIVSVVCGLLAVRRRQPSAWLFLVATGALVLGVAAFALRVLGVIPTTFFTSNGMQIGSMVEMLTLSLSMANRIHALRREKSLAQDQALHAKQLAMDVLQQSEKALEQRILERTAELAQSNARLLESESALKAMALHDALTGLPNRVRLQDQLKLSIARSKREGVLLAVLMIDLDGFKPINDRYGHAAGDQLLREIGRRLSSVVRETDTVARLGGDEFVVLLESAQSEHFVSAIVEKLTQSVREPVSIDGGKVSVGASVGVALCPAESDDIDRLLQLADQAMYRSKVSRKAAGSSD
jgi:diguanylate cyclase (GGDEF)-like protein